MFLKNIQWQTRAKSGDGLIIVDDNDNDTTTSTTIKNLKIDHKVIEFNIINFKCKVYLIHSVACIIVTVQNKLYKL